MSSPLLRLPWRLRRGVLVDRPNRFTVRVRLKGEVVECHLHDPGRLEGLMVKDNQVLFRRAHAAGRRTKYDVVAIKPRGGPWVIEDSRLPNVLFERAVQLGYLLAGWDVVKKEVKLGMSRIDFIMRDDNGREAAVEVKGCTLVRSGIGLFPDAPTQRGRRHLRELINAIGRGYRSLICFVIMRPDARVLRPNRESDLKFSEELCRAAREGVDVTAFKVDLDLRSKFIRFLSEVGVEPCA